MRGHRDPGSITEADNNDGHFRSLIGLSANNGDTDLKHHIENTPKNALYSSP